MFAAKIECIMHNIVSLCANSGVSCIGVRDAGFAIFRVVLARI